MSVEVERFENDTADVALKHVQPGERIDIRPPTTTNSAVEYTAFNLSIAEKGSYSMTMQASEGPPDETTAPVPGTHGMSALSYMVVSHPDLTNENVSNASFTFTVDKAYLSERGSAPGDVALFRRNNESWAELETAVVGETDERYTFRANTTGLSVFTVGMKRQAISVESVSMNERSIEPGDTVKISAVITNDGRLDGDYTADLTVFGERVDSQTVSVPAGESVTVTFSQTFNAPGTYEILVDGQSTEVAVAGETTRSTEDVPTSAPGQPGFTAGLALMVLCIVALVARRW